MTNPEPIDAPWLASVPEACRCAGLSRSELYRRLASGEVSAVKNGSRTLIRMDTLRGYIATLPPATFRAPKSAGAAR